MNIRLTPGIVILMLISIIMAPLVLNVQGLDSTGGASIFIESRFKLWDPAEKMIDKNFEIHIFYNNITNNNTGYLEIWINGDLVNNTVFTNYTKLSYSYPGERQLSLLIKLDNTTILNIPRIQIISGITGSGLRSWKPTFLEINPQDWESYQWNEFYSIFSGVIFSIYIGYRCVKIIRKKSGGVKVA